MEVTTVQHPLCEQRCGDRKGLGTQGGKGDSFFVRAKGDWEIEHCSHIASHPPPTPGPQISVHLQCTFKIRLIQSVSTNKTSRNKTVQEAIGHKLFFIEIRALGCVSVYTQSCLTLL